MPVVGLGLEKGFFPFAKLPEFPHTTPPPPPLLLAVRRWQFYKGGIEGTLKSYTQLLGWRPGLPLSSWPYLGATGAVCELVGARILQP